MKLFCIVAFIFCLSNSMAQGKFAGLLKKMIGVKYTDDKHIKGLEGFSFREGSIVSPLEDDELFDVSVYQKGNVYAVFFSLSDSTKKTYQILDILEFKNVTAGQVIKTITCREYKAENVEIVALVKYTKSAYLKNVIKAWRFSRDKIRFEKMDSRNVDCMNEGFGE